MIATAVVEVVDVAREGWDAVVAMA